MTDINPKGKYNEDMNVNNRVDESNAEKLSSRSRRSSMGEQGFKSSGDAVFKTNLDKDPTQGKGHGKPEMRAGMVNIIDVIMPNSEYEAVVFDIINTGMLNTEDVADIINNVIPNTEYEAVGFDIINMVMLNIN
jgi:hypothetical protein